jgi:hypothetical protein
MLDAGLSSLYYLKSRILPAGGVGLTDWDDSLSKLGLAVARRFENFCNRRLERVEDAAEFYSARSTSVCLKCYPVEAVTSVQLRDTGGTLLNSTTAYHLHKSSGVIEFTGSPGSSTDALLITYAGGYWLDDGGTMPTDATPLPDDLLEAWVMQCQAWAEARQIFGTVSLTGMEPKKNAPDPVKLADVVEAILIPYRRFSGE